MRKTLQFLLAFLWGALRGRPVEVPHVRRGGPRSVLTPDGRLMPVMAGGDETPEEKAAREEAERKAAEDEVSDDVRQLEEEEEQDEDIDDIDDPEPFDRERAERTIKQQRKKEREEREKRQKAERERDELRQAQETEHETAKRERDEARAEADRAKSTANRMIIDAALRDAAADADVDPKKVRRLLKLVDRDGITVDDEGEATGATEALADFLDEFPEFKAGEAPPANEPPKEEPGGNPSRSREPKELTAEQVQKMAAEDPERFNQLFDEGKIPASALSKS